MIPRTPALFLCAAALVGVAHADILPASGTITAATVYLDRAVVSRTADVKLPAGEHEIVFEALPLNLLADSLQVSGLGDGVTLLDVRHKRVTLAAPAQPRAAELQKEIDALVDEDRALQNRAAATERSLELLRDIETTWVTSPRDPEAAKETKKPSLPSLEEYGRLITFGEEARIKGLSARAGIEKQRAELARSLAEKRRELDALGVKNPRERTVEQVVVRVVAKAAVSGRVTLAYGVTGATWSPAYDARLAYADRSVSLNYFGVVQNGTGEDWNGVTLKLSTARPNLSAQVPVPEGKPLSERAIVYPGSKSGSFSQGSRALDSSFRSAKSRKVGDSLEITAGTPLAEEAEAPAFAVAHAAVAETGTAATFEIATAANLPNDNTPHRVAIGEAKLPADLRYEIVPALSEFAYLTGKIRNTTALPFLRGPVSVFIDGSFVSTSQVATTAPQDAFTLSFGVDEAVVVKRKPLVKFTEDAGLTGKYTRTTYTWVTEVTNNRRNREKFLVKEVLPVSRHEEIEVKALVPREGDIDRKNPDAARHLDAQGILTATHQLEPGKKTELTFSYSVEHPKTLAITPVE